MTYIDPNTGGMLFQIRATSFALLSGLALVFARQIRMTFARLMRSFAAHPVTKSGRAQTGLSWAERDDPE